MNRQTAILIGETRYHGKVCEKHPELKGERLVTQCRCVGCKRDAKREARRRVKLES